MIRFKVIKIKKCVLFLSLGLFATILITTLKSNSSQKALPAFGNLRLTASQKVLNANLVQKLSKTTIERLLCMGLPMLNTLDVDESPRANYISLGKAALRILTNIDIDQPESYFSLQIPLLNLTRTEFASTPGVEPMPENPPIVENEHEAPKDPPQAPEPDTPTSEVEKIVPVQGKPLVLIYHTHTTESYMPSKAYSYKPRDSAYHTNDLNFSVAKVGDVLTDELNKFGIPALHNKTIHDVPTYITSYTNSLKTVEQVLKAYPSIKIIIDLHRDAPVANPQKSREMTTVKIDGKTYSRIMLVVGSDKIFPNPHWKDNYRFAVMIHDKLEQLYPGIARDIDLREQRFNQHLSNKAILVEIGSHGNTMEESIESAKVFAKALAEVIKKLTPSN